jgi:hypothetical protein
MHGGSPWLGGQSKNRFGQWAVVDFCKLDLIPNVGPHGRVQGSRGTRAAAKEAPGQRAGNRGRR